MEEVTASGGTTEWVPVLAGVVGLVAVCGGLAGGAAVCLDGSGRRARTASPAEEIPMEELPGGSVTGNASNEGAQSLDQCVVENEHEVN